MKSRITFSDGKKIPYSSLSSTLFSPRDLAAWHACITYGLMPTVPFPLPFPEPALYPYIYSWYHMVWSNDIQYAKTIPVCFKHMCIIRSNEIKQAATFVAGRPDDLYTFVMYCKLIGRKIRKFTPAVPLLSSNNGAKALKISFKTQAYKNIYEAMLAYHTHLSIHYMIRIISSKKRAGITKYELYNRWIAWMESMGVLYAAGLRQLQALDMRQTTICFIVHLLWAKCMTLGICAFKRDDDNNHDCRLRLDVLLH